MDKRSEYGFRHNLPVRIGSPTGPKGRLLQCNGRTGQYWKVKLDSGDWVWPDDIIVDDGGDRIEICLDCRLRFLGKPGELICRRCQETTFGTADERRTAVDDARYRPRSRGTYRRRGSHI